MKPDTNIDLPVSALANATLDSALEFCLLALERGDSDPESLPRRFPKWETEIVEFLNNWGGMEHLAAGLSATIQQTVSIAADEELPRDFGEFELLQRIGTGGMGTIYKARQKSLDRFVAIKILRRDPVDAGRFRMEAEAAAALSHPNIVAIYEVGITDDSPWLCMQFIEGCNLKQLIDRKTITPEDAARLTRTIALSVNHAHQRGILHRDLKPANVLMNAQQQPFVTDFGLAKLIKYDTDLTQSGTILGTPGYMSPEQATGKVRSLTVATDVYGLGALLYALLTGNAPFTGESPIEILRRVVEESAASPRLGSTDVDRDLATICLKCLEKSTELRYHSAEALADDLGRYLDGQPVLARPVSSSERFIRWCQRNPAIAGLSGAVVALMIATTFFAAFLAWSERNTRLLVEENARTESSLRKEVTSALEEEQNASRIALKTQINLVSSNAIWHAKNNNVGEALLWFTEAAALSANDPEKIQHQLIQYESWLKQHPIPVAAMLLPSRYNSIEELDEIQFNPTLKRLLYRSRSAFVAWDYERGNVWHLNDFVPDLTYAIWSSDGNSVLAGCRDGQVVSFDLEDSVTKNAFQVEGPVNRLVLLDRDQKLGVATGKNVFVFDIASGMPTGDVLQHQGTIVEASANRSGDRLVCSDNSKIATVYAVDAAGIRKVFEHRNSYYSVSDGRRSFYPVFVKNDKAVLIRSDQNSVLAFDVETGNPLGPIEVTFPVHSHAVSIDGNVVLSGGFNHARLSKLGEMSIPEEAADSPRLKVTQSDQFTHAGHVSAVSVGTGGLFATGGWNNEVRIWRSKPARSAMNLAFDLPERVVPLAVLPHQNRLRRIQFTSDGRQLVTIQIDGLVRVWKIPEFGPSGTSLTVEPGGSFVKSVDSNRWMTSGTTQWSGHMENASAYSFADGTFSGGNLNQSRRKNGHLLDAACSPDGTQLVTIHASTGRSATTIAATDGTAGSLRFWNMHDSQPVGNPIPIPSEPRSVAYRPDGQQVAVCTARMEVLLFNAASQEIEGTLRQFGSGDAAVSRVRIFPQHPVNEQVTYSPDGSILIAWSTRHRGVGIWDVNTLRRKHAVVHADQPPLAGISISPDGRYLAMAGGQNATVTIMDLETGVLEDREFPHPSFVHSVSFSPNGNLLVTGCRDGSARLIDWRSGEFLIDQIIHDADVVAATFTPDSKFLLTLGLDDQMRVWHADDGSLAARPTAVPAGSSQLLVSDDSMHVVVAGGHILNVDLTALQQAPQITLPLARQMGELLASKTIVDGKPYSLSAQQWMDRWQKYWNR